MRKIIILALIFSGCGEESTDIKYNITKAHCDDYHKKCNIYIDLLEKPPMEELTQLSTIIINRYNQWGDEGNIGLSYTTISNQTWKDGCYWAVAHTKPGFEVKINGTSQKADNALDTITIKNGRILGKWKEIIGCNNGYYIIYEQNGQVKLKEYYTSSISKPDDVTLLYDSTIIERKYYYDKTIRYDFPKDAGRNEFFIKQRNGKLGIWSHDQLGNEPDHQFSEAMYEYLFNDSASINKLFPD